MGPHPSRTGLLVAIITCVVILQADVSNNWNDVVEEKSRQQKRRKMNIDFDKNLRLRLLNIRDLAVI